MWVERPHIGRHYWPISPYLQLAMAFEFYRIISRPRGIGRPLITFVFILIQAIMFFRVPLQIPIMWRPSDVCLSANRIINGRDYHTLFYSQLQHSYDMHLYYNILAFLSIGIYLERRFGSLKFFIILVTFILFTGLAYVGLQFSLASLYEDNWDRLYSCVVGFSGVIFALKVLSTHLNLEYDRDRTYYIGVFQVPERYLVWVELVLISLVLPNASFVGHFSGIVVGYAYTRGPLKNLVNSIHALVQILTRPIYRRYSRSRFTSTGQPSGRRVRGGNQEST